MSATACFDCGNVHPNAHTSLKERDAALARVALLEDRISEAVTEIAKEREHQDAKWGGAEHDDAHSPSDWRGYIIPRLKQESLKGSTPPRRVLVEAAALIVAWIESIDRLAREEDA